MVRKTVRKRTTTKKAAPRKRRTVARRKKGMLSELFNANMAQAGGKVVLSGAIGGVGAALLTKLLPDAMETKTKSFYQLGAGFVAATILKMPNVGAGMAGVGMFNLASQSGFLAEGGDYADDLEALPMVLSENDAMYLSEAGSMYLAENGMYLAEDSDIYPNYDFASFGVDL